MVNNLFRQIWDLNLPSCVCLKKKLILMWKENSNVIFFCCCYCLFFSTEVSSYLQQCRSRPLLLKFEKFSWSSCLAPQGSALALYFFWGDAVSKKPQHYYWIRWNKFMHIHAHTPLILFLSTKMIRQSMDFP